MEDKGCLGAFFLGADILLVIGDLITILTGKANLGDYISFLCAIAVAVCIILQYRENR